MRLSRLHIVLLAVSVAALTSSVFYIVGRADQANCLSRSESKRLEGHYARKDTWDRLPIIKEWAKIGAGGANWIDAVQVMPSGDSQGIFGWHEGSSVCIQLRNGQLWAKPIELPPNPPEEWQGPFVFLGKKVNIEDAYFARVFQGRCYDADSGETWCFGGDSIQVGEKMLRASLVPDQSEMPTYGTPVSVVGQEEFLMFVPFGDGWKIFKDSFASEEGHIDIDPNKSSPWKVLSPQKSGGPHG